MVIDRLSPGSAHATAIFVRVAAFVIAAASVVIVPAVITAAAVGHVTAQTAFVIAGIAVGLTLLAGLAARSVDPLRG